MSRVVAVSRGTPRWEEVGGLRVFTSIVRDPHPGALPFGTAGPEGNATAVHTEHVLAFPAEHYDYWTGRFGIDRAAWNWCHWGENLTVEGLDENTLRVGDVLRIGPRAVLQVTSPRIPCFKLAWRIGQPDTMLRSLIETGRIGFYLRVLEPGPIAAGDPIRLSSPHPDGITVGDLSRLLIDDALEDADRLRRVLAMPALGSQAAGSIRYRISVLTDGARTRDGGWPGWRDFVVTRTEAVAEDVRSFHLAPADGGPIAPYRAGQFLTVKLPLDSGEAIRCWSLSDYAETPGPTYRLTVRRTRAKGASSWLHEQARPGTRLALRAPVGRFMLDRGGFSRVVLISAGIGVTPLIAMLRAHAARSDAPPLLWIHVTRSGATHALRDEAAAVLAAGGDFTRLVHYTQPGPEDRPGRDFDRAGRPDPAAIAELVARPYTIRPFGREVELPGVLSDAYLCGPPGFETAIRAALEQAGVAPQATGPTRPRSSRPRSASPDRASPGPGPRRPI
jgi:ferredoxin-NADP reductase/MOSC domain-containing protein YiiM